MYYSQVFIYGKQRFEMHSSQSRVYGETLARCTYAVYPLAFFGRSQDGRLVCSMCFG
jgi:hypothetical protein